MELISKSFKKRTRNCFKNDFLVIIILLGKLDKNMENNNSKNNRPKVVPKIKHRYGSDYQIISEKSNNKYRKKNICDTHIDGA